MGFLQNMKRALQRRGGTIELLPVTEGVAGAICQLAQRCDEARRAVASSLGDTKRLEMSLTAAENRADAWHDRARSALDEGDEALTRELLERRLACQSEAGELRIDYERQKAGTDKLMGRLNEIQGRLDTTKREYHLLEARLRAAEARKQIGDAAVALDGVSPEHQLSVMLEAVTALEAQVETSMALVTGLSPDAKLEGRFAELSRADEVEAALGELKSGKRRADA